jgi:hypothetical protein
MSDIFEQAQQVAAHGYQRSLDRDMFQFLTALDNGDFETLSALYKRAERDTELAQLLDEAHEEYIQDEIREGKITPVTPEESERIKTMVLDLIRKHEGETNAH